MNGEPERCQVKDGNKNKRMDFSEDKSMEKLIIPHENIGGTVTFYNRFNEGHKN